MKAWEKRDFFMRKIMLSAILACLVLSSVQVTGFAAEKSGFVCKIIPIFCQNQQKPIQKPEADTAPETSVKPETEQNTSFQSEVLRLVNEERAKSGLKALVLDSALSSVAQKHSEDMAKNNYFSHTNLSGLSPFDRIKNAGITYRTAAENIAAGQKTPAQVVKSWMNSDGHRKNILNGNFTKMGLGYATSNSGYGIYWTQVFTG